jgi:hypothetical protein
MWGHSPVELHRRSGGTYCLHLQGWWYAKQATNKKRLQAVARLCCLFLARCCLLSTSSILKMVEVHFSETSVNFYRTTSRHVSEFNLGPYRTNITHAFYEAQIAHITRFKLFIAVSELSSSGISGLVDKYRRFGATCCLHLLGRISLSMILPSTPWYLRNFGLK